MPNDQYRLKHDLYVFNSSETKDLEYRLFTKAQLDEIVSMQYPAGAIFTHDAENGFMTSPEHGEIGLDPGDPDPNWWEPYDLPVLAADTYDVRGPNGETIAGTYEALTGASVLNGIIVREDGALVPEYDGTTNVHWNGQCTKYSAGERLYVDDEGAVFRESQLVLIPKPVGEVEQAPVQTLHILPLDSEGGHCD